MSFHHERIQHPAGQGSFHTAHITTPSSRFRYVYDCGSTRAKSALRRSITTYRDDWRWGEALDLLVISHAHNDHINGLRELFADREVDTIMLPFLSSAERLIAFARSLADDPAPEDLDFLRRFSINPVAALSLDFGPRQILLVTRGGSSGAAADGDAPVIVPTEPTLPRIGGRSSTGREGWRLVGHGRVSYSRDAMANSLVPHVSPVVARISHDNALLIGASSWLISTYIEPEAAYRIDIFLDILRRKLDGEPAYRTPTSLLRLFVHDERFRGLLVDAYKTFTSDLNAASLCLYSGPVSSDHNQRAIAPPTAEKADAVRGRGEWGGRVAWLGTGDAMLKGTKRVGDLLRHYREHIGKVGTLTLPHHGSDHNADEILIEQVGARCHVASAESRSRHHPGPAVRDLLSGRDGSHLTVVTEDPASTHVETVP